MDILKNLIDKLENLVFDGENEIMNVTDITRQFMTIHREIQNLNMTRKPTKTFKDGDRVKCVLVRPDFRQDVKLDDTGTITGFRTPDQFWVHFDGQPEAMSMLEDEIDLI